RCEPDDQLVEGALHVEQHGVEPRIVAWERDTPRAAVEVAQPERVAQALRGIDGENGRPPASPSGADREGRGGRRLTRAAAPGAETQAAAVEDLGDGHAASRAACASSRASTSIPPSASGPANRNGSRTGAAPSARRSARTCPAASRRRSSRKRAAATCG